MRPYTHVHTHTHTHTHMHAQKHIHTQIISHSWQKVVKLELKPSPHQTWTLLLFRWLSFMNYTLSWTATVKSRLLRFMTLFAMYVKITMNKGILIAVQEQNSPQNKNKCKKKHWLLQSSVLLDPVPVVVYPGGHGKQSVCPVSFWNDPTSHSWHWFWLVLYWPIGHTSATLCDKVGCSKTNVHFLLTYQKQKN